MTEDRAKIRQELNEKAKLWADKTKSREEKMTDRLYGDIFLLTFKLYDLDPYDEKGRREIQRFVSGFGEDGREGTEYFIRSYPEAFLSALEVVFHKYDSTVGLFTTFMSNNIKWKLLDSYRHRVIFDPEAKNIDEPIVDKKGKEEKKMNLENVIPDERAVVPGKIGIIAGGTIDIAAQLLNFEKHFSGKANNPQRKAWYHMFYTEDITWWAQEVELEVMHERDVFAAMELDYLDYYMLEKCRKIREIKTTPLKPYHEVVPENQSMEEIPLPMKADVSLAFWERCRGEKKGASSRSNMLGDYEKWRNHFLK